MTPRCFLALILCFALSSSTSLSGQSSAADSAPAGVDEQLAADLLSRIQKSGADVAVAFRTLDGKLEWFSRADEVFHAASTMKIPVMIELFHQRQQGKLKLEDPLPIKCELHSLVDAAIYKRDPADDS